MKYETLENLSCFVKPVQSDYTKGAPHRARNTAAVAMGLASMKQLSSKITGDMIPADKLVRDIVDATSHKSGFRVSGGGALTAIVIGDIVDNLPDIIYKPEPLFDPDQFNFIDGIIKTFPLPLTQPQRQKIAISKPTEQGLKQKKFSTIWAKSQGNTVINSVTDWRFAPTFYGIRL